MTNQVTYSIALIPENAEKIDQINRILLDESYTAEAPKQGKSTTAVDDQTSQDPETEKEDPGLTFDEVKKVAKSAKKNHGEDFANAVLDEFNVKAGAILGRRISAIEESDYKAIVDKLNAGPKSIEQAADEPEDDFDDGLNEDESKVTADAVKTALKSYAKEKGRERAKEIMEKNGASALSKVDNCTQAQLNLMLAELV